MNLKAMLFGNRPTETEKQEYGRDAAVRRAYRLAAKNCHPDVLRATGASEGRIAAATEQMARLNDAWDAVRKARGL